MQNNDHYWSASKGTLLPISEMETHHLTNAIIKLERERDNNSPYPVQVLDSLKAEQYRRREAQRAAEAAGTPATPAPAAKTETADSPLFAFTRDLIALANDLQTGPPLSSDALVAKLQQLASTVNGGKTAAVTPAATAPVPTAPAAEATGPVLNTPLAQLPEEQYPALTSATLLNSLAQHNIHTVLDLTRLAACDFGAVRFSTVAAFVEATSLLLGVGHTWAAESTILRMDGAINRVINPNASAIGLFVTEAQSRLRPLVLRLQNGDDTPVLREAINRVAEGVKRRVALAAQVHSMVILARGGQTKEEIRRMLATLPVSDSMRHQIWLHLNRLSMRLRRVGLPATAAEPVPA